MTGMTSPVPDPRADRNGGPSPGWTERVMAVAAFLAVLIPVFAGVLYVAGWSYAYRYLQGLGVGLLGVPMPPEYLFLYGFWVIRANIVWLGLGLLLIILLAYRVAFHGQWRPLRVGLAWLSPVILFALVALAYSFGAATARKHVAAERDADFSSMEPVAVMPLDAAKDALPEVVVADLAAGCYRQIVRTADTLYLLRPIADMPDIPPTTLALRLHHVLAVQHLPPRKPCP